MPGMGPGLAFLAVVVIAVFAFGAARARRAATNGSWAVVAQQLGLSFKPAAWNASPRLAGELEGYPLSVDFHKRGAGQSRTTWTRFKLGVPPLPAGLELRREGFLSGIARAFGAGDIEVGDDTFDRKILVKGHDAAAIRDFLTPARRHCILRFLDTHSRAVIDSQAISWSTRGRISESSRLLSTVREMLRLARSLAAAEPQSESSPVDEKVSDATPSALSDRRDGADALPAPTARPLESAGNAANADSPPVAVFADAVFAPGKPSVEAARSFADRYQGTRVAWTGTLQSVEPYRFDFVFGSGPGVKATLAIHTSQAAAFGDGQVRAVIGLPATTAGLDTRIGERVGFSGTLFKVDGFTKKVFVTGAALRGRRFAPTSPA